jgi:DNA-binding response OmpR family regulator
MVNRSPRVLVVEDEHDIAGLIKHALERSGEGQVTIVSSGDVALRAVSDQPPDVIILDLNLPVLSGTEVCRILRSRPATANIPIIMLTARTAEADRVSGLDLGADDYVTKPFSLRELSARIRALFRRSEQVADTPAGGPAVLDLGRVQVDLAGHRLLRDGDELAIKPKAFELLVFLLRHPGQAFTRDQLLEHVWGYDYAGETRTVDVHVHWLRTTLEDDAAAPKFIHTVRGVGYVFRRPAELASA